MNLIQLNDLRSEDIRHIWSLVTSPAPALDGTVAWSFEGNGIRTRTTFIEAFRRLGLAFTELPNLLKTSERTCDLAGYLDPFFRMYVVREANHARLAEFAAASKRPVINAMSAQGHPCEVLTDAYFVDTHIKPLSQARVCLWGPSTNVFRSWHELARVLGLELVQICHRSFHEALPHVSFAEPFAVQGPVDVVITDSWPAGAGTGHEAPIDLAPLTAEHLATLGHPALLPTPPFTLGRELTVDPLDYPGFVGYRQKELLLPVHIAILRWALDNACARETVNAPKRPAGDTRCSMGPKIS
ncbi:ornithine carbamoyltransferase [Acidovorax sp. 1608163]|uniref:ornithine carbamoyltransferase n=1 Tax=Acidovorax sp. 1608163 TaxID=2478662 RepID=UPI000EF6422E|nr:ornithine carbamoyltransferase [Acidovorax sp. 1608163]AYM96941.1 ornithine carbamoyltransferase [Acidovorax sp. 1608163]